LDATHVVHPTEDSARDDKSNWKFPFRAGPDDPTNTRALVAIKGSRGVEGAKGLSDSMKSQVESWANDLLEKAPDDMFGSITTNAEAEFSEGDLVKWETSASPGTGRVAQVVTDPGSTVTSEADVDNPPTREATEDEPVYKLDDWTGDGFNSGQVVKSESEMVGMWDAPEEVRSNARVPDSLRFDNPGEAVEKAAEMGFDEMGDLAGDEMIHTHGAGDEMIFMPGPSHERLMERLDEIDAASKHMDEEEEDDMDSASKHGEEMDSASGHMEDEDMDAAAGHPGQMKDDSLKDLGRRVAEALGLVENDSGSGGSETESNSDSEATTGAESPTETTDQTQTMDRSEKIDYIVSNSALTEGALEERCNDGIDAIYSDVAENSPDSQTDSKSMTDNENEVVLTEDELDDMIAEKAREIVANQKEQSEKESLATDIVANSAEYDSTDGVLEDFPTTAALKAKKESLGGGGMPAGGLSVNDIGADDIDVSSGVLGGD